MFEHFPPMYFRFSKLVQKFKLISIICNFSTTLKADNSPASNHVAEFKSSFAFHTYINDKNTNSLIASRALAIRTQVRPCTN